MYNQIQTEVSNKRQRISYRTNRSIGDESKQGVFTVEEVRTRKYVMKQKNPLLTNFHLLSQVHEYETNDMGELQSHFDYYIPPSRFLHDITNSLMFTWDLKSIMMSYQLSTISLRGVTKPGKSFLQVIDEITCPIDYCCCKSSDGQHPPTSNSVPIGLPPSSTPTPVVNIPHTRQHKSLHGEFYEGEIVRGRNPGNKRCYLFSEYIYLCNPRDIWCTRAIVGYYNEDSYEYTCLRGVTYLNLIYKSTLGNEHFRSFHECSKCEEYSRHERNSEYPLVSTHNEIYYINPIAHGVTIQPLTGRNYTITPKMLQLEVSEKHDRYTSTTVVFRPETLTWVGHDINGDCLEVASPIFIAEVNHQFYRYFSLQLQAYPSLPSAINVLILSYIWVSQGNVNPFQMHPDALYHESACGRHPSTTRNCLNPKYQVVCPIQHQRRELEMYKVPTNIFDFDMDIKTVSKCVPYQHNYIGTHLSPKKAILMK